MKIHVQAIRYGVVGIVSNGILYLLYLLLTWLGMGHKTAMSLLYAAGIVQTFVFNRQWTFNHSGVIRRSFPRYVATYALGYLFQLAMLLLFVDKLHYPHQFIMAILIIATAAMIFILQKYWVFSEDSTTLKQTK